MAELIGESPEKMESSKMWAGSPAERTELRLQGPESKINVTSIGAQKAVMLPRLSKAELHWEGKKPFFKAIEKSERIKYPQEAETSVIPNFDALSLRVN